MIGVPYQGRAADVAKQVTVASVLTSLPTPYLLGACTLALVLFHGIEAAPLSVLAGLGLLAFIVDRSVVLRWWFWLPVALVFTYELTLIWEDTGNHFYVICYWLWAVTLAAFAPRQRTKVLVVNAHILLVFVFGAAVYQKLASATYLSGEMFEMKLLRSGGFREFAEFFGVPTDVMASSARVTDLLRDPALSVPGNAVLVPSSDHVHTLALWLTWYDLLVQVAVVIAFLIPNRVVQAAGHLALLFFIATAYVWVQILEFGWVITVMGLAMSRDRFPVIGALYFAMLGLLLLYALPIGALMNRFLGA